MLPDITALLIPVSLESPAGDNLEYEPLFDDIRQARESDPEYLQQDEWSVSKPRKADWMQVRILSEKALREQTKDLQLACWFVEALCHQQGLAGVNTGIEFLSEFITRFWFQCWPSLEEEGGKIRRSKLLRLDRDLSQQLFLQPLLSQPGTSLASWRQSLDAEHNDRETAISQGGDLTTANVDQQVLHFSSSEIARQADQLFRLGAAFEQFEARYLTLSQDQEGELFVLTRQTLADLTDYLQRLKRQAIPLDDEIITPESVIENDTLLPDKTPYNASPQAMSRERAISQMLSISEYFRKTEPSSPVPFLMERASRWATMTLPEWLEEMLTDSNSINEINNVLRGSRH